MADYKHTLNLPQTAFPMRGNLPQREPEMLAFWQEKDIYAKQRAQFADKPMFLLHDGPPYANGMIHVGHALNKILKDIIIKSRHLLGFNSPYVPGWDCHGLPIEQKVEQKFGKPGVKISEAEFRAQCRAFASSQVALQKEDFIRLGVFGYWDKPYLTMDPKVEAGIVRALADIVANGHVVDGFKPVHWCLDCRSSLAEAEIEYQDKTSFSIDVAFEACDKTALGAIFGVQVERLTGIDVVIWTTTPWTLPANVAVSVHPEFDYVLMQEGDRGVVVAADLLESLQQKWEIDSWRELARVKGAQLDRVRLRHPFIERESLMINGEHVTLEQGTGCVHTAPAHGVEDYEVCKVYGLELINPVLSNGTFSQDTPLVGGMQVFAANEVVVKALFELGRLRCVSKIEHSYPHCWRHKTPTIFRATTQWFISMEKADLRETALEGLKEVKFTPQWGQARLTSMIENRPDWCISRQRFWGVPLCFVVHKESGALHPNNAEIMHKVADIIEQEGIEAWFTLPLEALLPADEVPLYEKLNDVLDVWFDSGVTHYAVMCAREELSYPADLYLEGSDQHRGWFHSSLLTGSAIDGRPPYKALLTHGFTVDENGHKMSKSVGNVVEPQKVIKQMGADVLRLWVASADYSAEIRLSDNILKQRADAYRRIRNTARFLLANLHDFDPKKDLLAPQEMVALDRYAIASAYRLQQALQQAYVDYEFHLIYQQLFNYCSVTLGGFYLDVIKDRQYTIATDNRARRSAQTAIYHILEALVRWIAPILSFTAEEIWQVMPGEREESVFLTTFYDGLFDLEAEDVSEETWQTVMRLRDEVNHQLEKARQAGEIGGSLAAEVKLSVAPEVYALLKPLEAELRFAFIVSKLTLEQGAQMQIVVEASKAPKCERCWHHVEDVGAHADYPDLCGRCVENVAGAGEVRRYI